jgi:DNA recombination protein RmuC
MSSLSELLLLAIAVGGTLAAWFVARKLGASEVARATSDAGARAAAREAELSAHLQASERRTADLGDRLDAAIQTVANRDAELRAARDEITRHKTAEATFETRLAELTKSQSQLKEAFNSLCSDALKSNNEQFLQLARTELERIRVKAQTELTEKETAIQSLVTPIKDGLEKYDRKLSEIEVARAESFASLNQRIEGMSLASDVLRGETANLAKALRSSNVRGAWGELQLKRAVELAGMLEHCDFDTQHSVDGEDGKLRPDMVVRLPGGKSIVVDAKTPATEVLEAVNCADDARRRELCVQYVLAVKKHIEALSKKAYWEQFANAPEFVVLFLPSEAFFSVALEFDPTLFEHSFEQKVIIATPTTLVAVLKAIAFGWRQESIAQNAQEISELGKELYERIRTLAEHFEHVGDHLGKSVVAYNRAVGSLETRVLPQARRFQSLGVGSTKPIAELSEISVTSVPILASELRLPLAARGDA